MQHYSGGAAYPGMQGSTNQQPYPGMQGSANQQAQNLFMQAQQGVPGAFPEPQQVNANPFAGRGKAKPLGQTAGSHNTGGAYNAPQRVESEIALPPSIPRPPTTNVGPKH